VFSVTDSREAQKFQSQVTSSTVSGKIVLSNSKMPKKTNIPSRGMNRTIHYCSSPYHTVIKSAFCSLQAAADSRTPLLEEERQKEESELIKHS